jgi:hypothetical protein
MSAIWTITGEAGKTVDATARTLTEMQAEACVAEFASLAPDTLVWEAWMADLTDTAHIPDYGQVITLWRNEERFFTGHVTGRCPQIAAGRFCYAITVSGPWYWLANTSISSEVEDASTVVVERSVYLFATGSPTDHLISLVSRAVALGMPVALGSIATCFDVPRLSLRDMSFAEAISEIMRWIPDGLVYIDYSGEGYPALCMQRRATATTITLPIADVATPSLSLVPRYDLQVEELSIYYARRGTVDNERVTLYETQTAGTATGPLPARQLIASTGPELDTYLPQDITDSVVVSSAGFDVGAALAIHHDLLKAGHAQVEVASAPIIDLWSVGGGDYFSGGGASGSNTWPQNPLLVITDPEGNAINLAEWPLFLTKGEIKDWWEKDGWQAIKARVTATVYTSAIVPFGDAAPTAPEWTKILGATLTSHFVNQGNGLCMRYVWQTSVSCVVPLTKHLFFETTLIRSEDWGWLNPPEGLAANLLAAQNWIPWEGRVPVVPEDIPPGNAVGSVLNITGFMTETSAMRALISSYTVRPSTGQITYTLGPPARHSYRDLCNRFRQSGADNMCWISGQAVAPVFPLEAGLPGDAVLMSGQGISFDSSILTYTPD